MKTKSYCLDYEQCLEAFGFLANNGYRWKLSSFVSEGILCNMQNPMNVPGEMNFLIVDGNNKFVYNNCIQSSAKSSYLFAHTYGLDSLYEDVNRFNEFTDSRNFLFSYLMENLNYLDHALMDILYPFEFSISEKLNLYHFMLNGIGSNVPCFMDYLTSLFLNNGKLLKDNLFELSFKNWCEDGNIDLNIFYLSTI